MWMYVCACIQVHMVHVQMCLDMCEGRSEETLGILLSYSLPLFLILSVIQLWRQSTCPSHPPVPAPHSAGITARHRYTWVFVGAGDWTQVFLYSALNHWVISQALVQDPRNKFLMFGTGQFNRNQPVLFFFLACEGLLGTKFQLSLLVSWNDMDPFSLKTLGLQKP